jgi:hypothetical protein
VEIVKGAEYLGIARPFWLRLTDDGVGVHVGGFERGRDRESVLNSW